VQFDGGPNKKESNCASVSGGIAFNTGSAALLGSGDADATDEADAATGGDEEALTVDAEDEGGDALEAAAGAS
jgi:hypothetical protein